MTEEQRPQTGLNIQKIPDMFGEDKSAKAKSNKKVYAAILLPALLIAVAGGAVIQSRKSNNNSDTFQASLQELEQELQAPDSAFTERNEERKSMLNTISETLEKYHEENGVYPATSNIEELFVEENFIGGIPMDPMHGESDGKDGLFGYTYAIYDTDNGRQTAYVLSALLEEQIGNYTWTISSDDDERENFRNYELSNVSLIEESKKTSPKRKSQ